MKQLPLLVLNVSDAVVIVRANTALGANGILDYTMVAADGCVTLADNGLVFPESFAISGGGVVGYNGAIMQLPPSIPGGSRPLISTEIRRSTWQPGPAT